jgi:hypothetical protein
MIKVRRADRRCGRRKIVDIDRELLKIITSDLAHCLRSPPGRIIRSIN